MDLLFSDGWPCGSFHVPMGSFSLLLSLKMISASKAKRSKRQPYVQTHYRYGSLSPTPWLMPNTNQCVIPQGFYTLRLAPCSRLSLKIGSLAARGYFPLSGQELVESGTGAPQEQLTSIISQSNTIQHQYNSNNKQTSWFYGTYFWFFRPWVDPCRALGLTALRPLSYQSGASPFQAMESLFSKTLAPTFPKRLLARFFRGFC